MIIPGDSDARGSQATLRNASASGLGWSRGQGVSGKEGTKV